MGSFSTSFALVLIIIIAIASLTLMMVKPASAQSVPKPSVPDFTMKYIDYSYDIPPTYGIDQYTGKTVITQQGSHVDNRTVEFTIKNQPFTAYNDTNGNWTTLYYNFRFKGAYGSDWSNYPDTGHSYGRFSGLFPDTSASNSDYTVIMINLLALTSYPSGTPEIPTGATIEFQVQAIMGYIVIEHTGMLAGDFYGFTGERSDWSNTQTITIGQTSASTSTSPNPTSTPTVPECALRTILPFIIVILFVVVMLKLKKPMKFELL